MQFFTSKERVLIHLISASLMDGKRTDQEIIARECGIGRTHVPRVLKPLMEDGLVEESLGRVPGHLRRIKVYFLTEEGLELAGELLSRARAKRISWVGRNGGIFNESVHDALRHVNDHLSSEGMVLGLSRFLSMDGDPVQWDEIEKAACSMEGGNVTVDIPCGWRPEEPPDMPHPLFPREKELAELERAYRKGGRIVVQGPAGSGKRSLVQRLSRAVGKKAIWLSPDPVGGGPAVEPPFGLVVVEEKREMAPLDAMMGKVPDIGDPRRDGWEGRLGEVPLFQILDSDERLAEGPLVVNIGGLERNVYSEMLTGKGLSDSLIDMLYGAVYGSASALSSLLKLPEGAFGLHPEEDEKEALFRILLLIGGKASRTEVNHKK